MSIKKPHHPSLSLVAKTLVAVAAGTALATSAFPQRRWR